MPEPHKIGQYRHQPATNLRPGPEGRPVPSRVRRRFPYLGLVPLGYGLLVPLFAAGQALVLKALNAVPRQLGSGSRPAPSLENVIFGFGFAELLVAWAVTGFLLWRILWNLRVPEEVQQAGLAGTLPVLMRTGALVGPFLALLSIPIAVIGLGTRDMPGVPWVVRPLFALVGSPVVAVSALINPAILLTILLMGLIVGVLSALAVAVLWRSFPEEPVLKG